MMISIKLSTLALGLAVLDLVSADGANFVVCVDWMPERNPDLPTPFQATAVFTPPGGTITCVNYGRGKSVVEVEADAPRGRYCSNQAVYAEVNVNSCGPAPHGVFPIDISGPDQWTGPQPQIAMDASGFGFYEYSATLSEDHANVVICEDLTGGCDYQIKVEWSSGALPTVALVWQPNGSLNQDPIEQGNPLETPENVDEFL